LAEIYSWNVIIQTESGSSVWIITGVQLISCSQLFINHKIWEMVTG